MRRIQNDNIRMVEKILLVKPTLPKKDHKEFYNKHRELSRRLSKNSESSLKKKQSLVNTKKSDADLYLPEVRSKGKQLSKYFKNEYKFSRKPK